MEWLLSSVNRWGVRERLPPSGCVEELQFVLYITRQWFQCACPHQCEPHLLPCADPSRRGRQRGSFPPGQKGKTPPTDIQCMKRVSTWSCLCQRCPPSPAAVQHSRPVKEPQRSQGAVCSFPLLSGLQAQVHLQKPRAAKHSQVPATTHHIISSSRAARGRAGESIFTKISQKVSFEKQYEAPPTVRGSQTWLSISSSCDWGSMRATTSEGQRISPVVCRRCSRSLCVFVAVIFSAQLTDRRMIQSKHTHTHT